MDALIAERAQAARRRRRLIFNNDGDDVFQAREPTPESFWAARCHGLEGSQVDAIFYSTTISFGLHTHDSRCAEIYESVADSLFTKNHVRSLISQGRDNLQLVTDFCHNNDMEAFWSLRMNDTHDNWYPMFQSELKRCHPELLLFRPEDIGRPRQGLVEPHMNATAVDYGRQEVRDLQFSIIQDVCDRYDIEGIELDFLRQPIFFRPTMEGRPVGPEHTGTMTEFVRRVRGMTESVGQARGRPLLIACRVPNAVSPALEIGLDVSRWLAEDLIDLPIASLEHAPFTGDLSEMVALARSHDKPVYACLPGRGGDLDQSVGAAMNAWSAGVDGIETFNEFNPKVSIWRILGDPQAMTRMDKVYAVDRSECRTWEHVVPQEGRLPIELRDGETCALRLPVADDTGAAGEGAPRLLVTVKVEGLTWRDQMDLILNGVALDLEVFSATEGVSPAACGTFTFCSRVEPGQVRRGDNEFEVTLRKDAESPPAPASLTALELCVQYSDT